MRSTKPIFLLGAISALAGTSVRADLVTDWNNQLLTAIKGAGAEPFTTPPKASYNLAVMQTAIYDAVNGVNRTYQPYLVTAIAPAGASAEAAINEAAYRILDAKYPAASFSSINASFTSFYNTKQAAIGAGQSKTDGQNWGASVAGQILGARNLDGSAVVVTDFGSTDPGKWRPANPANSGLLPGWGDVKPFGVPSVDPLMPVAPPALDSAAYALAYNQVKDLGSIGSVTRTADQTAVAIFWADGAGTVTPPGHWNLIAQDFVAATPGLSLVQSARTFAALNVAMADAAIASWDAKYAYDLWRPITAIRNGDLDGNGSTDKDGTWTPLLTTPNFPSYTSGHSTFSGAAAAVLSEYFVVGPSGFTTPSQDPSVSARSFPSFQAAAAEAGMSRIYGGIHFSFDNTAGLQAGASIGDYVVDNYFAAVPEVTTVGTVFAGALMAGGIIRRRRQVGAAK